MKLGILADIHEDLCHLDRALGWFRQVEVQEIVLLGDVFETGRRLEETVARLRNAQVRGVWGNHELGLCLQPETWVGENYARPILDYMQTLRPRWEVEDCLFLHGLPCWDYSDPLIYYLGGGPEEEAVRRRCFAAVPHPILFVGHFHRWLLATPQDQLAWNGETAVWLDPHQRWLVAVAALCNGWCASFDTITRELVPHRLEGRD